MRRFTVAINDSRTADQVEKMSQSLGFSYSKYFIDLHEAFFNRKVRGIDSVEFVDRLKAQAEIENKKSNPLAVPKMEGFQCVYFSDAVFERFNNWRLKTEECNPDAPKGYDAAIMRAMDELCGVSSTVPLDPMKEVQAMKTLEKPIETAEADDWDNF